MHWLPVFFLYFLVQPYSFSSVCGEVTAHDPQGHMLPHYEWVSDCGHIWYVRECEWEFVSCCPTLRMCASWSSHGHTLAIFKCRKRYCRSSLEVLVHEGQKGPGREPATQNVHVRAVRSYRNSRYNYKQIGGDFFFFCPTGKKYFMEPVVFLKSVQQDHLPSSPWHSCGFLIPCGWCSRGGGRSGSCSSQRCLG